MPAMQLQLHRFQQSAAAAWVQAAPAKTAPSARAPRRKTAVTHYQNDDNIGTAPMKAEVSAEGTYRAAAANMPEGAWAGRWERWAPPTEGFKGGIFRADEVNSGWQLLTSGQSVYVFKPSDSSSLSVSVMEAPDSPPLSMGQAAAQAAAEVALGAPQPGVGMPSHRTGSVGGSNVMRAENKFSSDDHFFRPYLPDQTQPGGDIGLRLWAADGLGFAMAPTSLPLTLLHTKGTAAPAAAVRETSPFIVNIYIKHPSLEPGVGRRWGWNLQFDAATGAAATAVSSTSQRPAGGPLQHIHHTSLGLVGLGEGRSAEDLLHPGPHTRPPTAPGPLPPSIAAFMAAEGHHWMRCNGSAVEFSYEGGRLTRTDIDTGDCGWHVGPAPAGGVAEVWYSSGGYTRCPVSLQTELAAGHPVTLEAGAVIYRSADLCAPVEGVARWLLTYRAGDGQLESVRLEVYKQHDH